MKRSAGSKLLIGFAFLCGGIAVLTIGLLIVGVALLPNPSEVSNLLSNASHAPTLSPATGELVQASESISATSESIANKIEAAIANPPEMKQTDFMERLKRPEVQAKYQAVFDQLFDDDPKDVRVCDNLGRMEMSAEELSRPRSILEMVGPRDGNAIAEAFRYPVVSALNDPALKDFYREAKDYERKLEGLTESEKNSWLRKAGFYTKLAKTMTSFISRKEKRVSDAAQGSALLTLAQLTTIRPKLAGDTAVQDLCRDIEAKAKAGELSEANEYGHRIAELLEREQLSQEDLGQIQILEAVEYKKAKKTR